MASFGAVIVVTCLLKPALPLLKVLSVLFIIEMWCTQAVEILLRKNVYYDDSRSHGKTERRFTKSSKVITEPITHMEKFN